ncbi:MAG TPA: DUF2490 domain-containing protein [Chitinophagales bacterium]|nr:DUF2490 domain-containing protein [Chitinophagales bacterium]
MNKLKANKLLLLNVAAKTILWLTCLIITTAALAQNTHNAEFWAGYITSARVSKHFSVWNDFHLVPTAFFINRHGLTWHITEKTALTSGYAFLVTATAASAKLVRQEHRPWGQLELRLPLIYKTTYRFRIRYDARFRQKMVAAQPTDEFLFYHRLRFMNSLNFHITNLSPQSRLTFTLMNEILLNFGQQYTGKRLDQNRIFALAGINHKHISVMAGYHHRMIPLATSGFNFKHGATVWVIQNFNLRRKSIKTSL